MGRLEDKLARAAGVAARVEQSMEKDADALIAREEAVMARKAQAFGAHNSRIDAQHKSMDRLEDALQIIDNGAPPDPLPDTGHVEVSPPTPEVPANPVETFQSTH